MTDESIIRKKLAFINARVSELERLGEADKVRSDVKEQYFVLHSLQLAIQAVIDVMAHVISNQKMDEPERLADMADALARTDWLTPDLARRLKDIIGFRNIIVHGYVAVDLDVVLDVLANHLDDLVEFTRQVSGRLDN